MVDLRINCQCRAGLGVTRLSRHCSDTDVRVGEQDTDKGVTKHMRVDFADSRLFTFEIGISANAAKLQPRAGRVLAAKVFNIFFV